MSEHLKAEVSTRGFRHMPVVEDLVGIEVRAYESSNAEVACVWLSVDNAAAAELTLEKARHLSEQLDWLIRHHYHGGHEGPVARPPLTMWLTIAAAVVAVAAAVFVVVW